MLPPQLQQGLRPRSLSMPASTTIGTSPSAMLRGSTPARSIWSWRRQADYTSHIDPQFQRFCRYRTLKTRAKLLDKLRRRGRWDWDADQEPFSSPKHVRLASHIGRPRWRHNEDGSEKKENKEVAEDDGYELSQREKEWKEQMEAMRRRIEQDPYEAVFGKRFEPFWSPLVPTWMREEMGLTRSQKSKDTSKSSNRSSPSEPAATVDVNTSKQSKKDPDAIPNGQLTEYAYPEKKKSDSTASDSDATPNGQLTSYSYSRKKPVSENADSPNGQLTTYSYSASTSWDSWTKTARSDEWDSISGQRRRYVYDPISNRMVQIESPASGKVAEPLKPFKATQDQTVADKTPSKASAESAVSVPIKTSLESRKAIPVPTNTIETVAKKTSLYFPSLLKNSLVTKNSGVDAVSETPEKALDTLTANDIRSSMGKTRGDRDGHKGSAKEHAYRLQEAKDKSEFIRAQLKAANLETPSSLQPSLDRMQSKGPPITVEPDDSAAHESTGDAGEYSSTNLPKDWEKQADLLQAERIRRTRGTSNGSPSLNETREVSKTRWIDIMTAKKAEYDAKKLAEAAAMEALDAEKNAKLKKANAVLEAEVRDQKLRMMAYQNRYAHGALADIQHKLEQKTPKRSEQPAATQDVQRERERYQQKIRDLRKELDTAFKQSSVNSEMHLERIRDLEREVAIGRNFGHDTLQLEKDRYVQKTKTLKEELDRTFKQSSVNAEMQVERIRDLERELEEARSSKPRPVKGVEATRGEGDFCANVTKYAKDDSKWYKKPCYIPGVPGEIRVGRPSNAELDASVRDGLHDMLVDEIKDIYEAEYGPIEKDLYEAEHGTIDTMKSEPQVVEVETDVDLGKALADYEKEQEYEFHEPQRTLEVEIAAEEKAAHEAQALLDPYPETCVMQTQSMDQDVHGARLGGKAPTIISSDAPRKPDAVQSSIQWEEPPLYKVLAYDSGNDMLTSAVTSSNVTGKEAPITIQEALSELYQPARFVPQFAELQREGFQVIHGTKDLLVFRKVKATTAASSQPQDHPPFEDHGLVKESSADITDSKSFGAGLNPIDGMGHSIEPNTGSFASPTGFVGDRWDALSPSESQAQSLSTASSKPWGLLNDESKTPTKKNDTEDGATKHDRRVKREEQVYSGSRLRMSKRARRLEARERFEQHQRRETWVWAVSGVLTTALFVASASYAVGWILEKTEEKRKLEEQKRRNERWWK